MNFNKNSRFFLDEKICSVYHKKMLEKLISAKKILTETGSDINLSGKVFPKIASRKVISPQSKPLLITRETQSSSQVQKAGRILHVIKIYFNEEVNKARQEYVFIV